MMPKLAMFDAIAVRSEVEEELQFHVDMCARDYESQGFSAQEASVRAQRCLGDITAIKRRCVQIRARRKTRMGATMTVCAAILALGACINISSSDFRVAQMGSVLVIIAVVGALLTLVRTFSVLHLVSNKEPLRLNLSSSD